MKPARALKNDYEVLPHFRSDPHHIGTYIAGKKMLGERLDALLRATGPEFVKVAIAIQTAEQAWLTLACVEDDFQVYGPQVLTIIGSTCATLAENLEVMRHDALDALLWLEEQTVSE